MRSEFYPRIVKRLLDLLVAMALLLVLMPLLILLALAGAIAFTGSPFFVQERIGEDQLVFSVIKFRSMVNADTPPNGWGRMLRKTSLDELPQLVNVLRGEMSIVGPRPLLPEYVPFYNEKEKKRHLVLPGITGWTQVKGRNKLGWEKRMILDQYYVDNQSFWLDLKILLLTMKAIFTKGSNSDDSLDSFIDYAKSRTS